MEHGHQLVSAPNNVGITLLIASDHVTQVEIEMKKKEQET
jgi:hypothetical protein